MVHQGQRVQFPGHGLGTLEVIDEARVTVQLDAGHRIHVPREAAEATLWPLPDAARAAALRTRLLTPAAPSTGTWAERHAAYEAVLRSGTLEDHVELLRATVARGAPTAFGERKLRSALEDDVVAPIAEALGEPPQALRDALG